MKKALFLLTAVALTANVAVSVTDVAEMSSVEYLKQQGYSTETARLVQQAKRDQSSVNVDREMPKNRFVRYVDYAFDYVDPGRTQGTFGKHDTTPNPRYDDL